MKQMHDLNQIKDHYQLTGAIDDEELVWLFLMISNLERNLAERTAQYRAAEELLADRLKMPGLKDLEEDSRELGRVQGALGPNYPGA